MVDNGLAGVVLAAGESRRMGQPKQLLPFGEHTILERVVDTLLTAGVGEVIVVLGHLAERVGAVLGDRPVRTVINASYRQGMLSSVKCGVRAIDASYDAALFALGDQPHIDCAVVSEVIRAYRAGSAGIVIPCYGGKKGHPIIINLQRYREAIVNLPDDAGLNVLMQEHADDVHLIDAATEDIIRDIDVPDDYTRELARFTERRSSI
ncbi:MAG TPA: nucleotidyltransferase family protein [Candidatus Tectomicrobia bacterium]